MKKKNFSFNFKEEKGTVKINFQKGAIHLDQDEHSLRESKFFCDDKEKRKLSLLKDDLEKCIVCCNRGERKNYNENEKLREDLLPYLANWG